MVRSAGRDASVKENGKVRTNALQILRSWTGVNELVDVIDRWSELLRPSRLSRILGGFDERRVRMKLRYEWSKNQQQQDWDEQFRNSAQFAVPQLPQNWSSGRFWVPQERQNHGRAGVFVREDRVGVCGVGGEGGDGVVYSGVGGE